MARTSAWRSALLAALVALAGCNEKLTTPGVCPLCPPTGVQLADTLLTAVDVGDTTARGYVRVSEATYLIASTLDSLKSVMLLKFTPLDTFWVRTGAPADTVIAAFPPDSVQFLAQVFWRDTTVHPRLVFYRLPARFDTTMTYAQAQAYFVDSLVVDTVAVPDTGNMSVRMPVSLVAPPGDSGVVALGVKVIADAASAVGIASGHRGTNGPRLSYYLHGQPPRDTLRHNPTEVTAFSTFVQAAPPGTEPPGVLSVGGLPSAHSLMHLALPKLAVDSVGIVRATLLVNLVRPIVSLPKDSFYVEARPLLRDYGPKSVLYPDSSVAGHTLVREGQTGTVPVDIGPILRLWGTTLGDSLPRVIMLNVFAEGNVPGQMDFQGRATGGGPQLRVTYVMKYTIGVP